MFRIALLFKLIFKDSDQRSLPFAVVCTLEDCESKIASFGFHTGTLFCLHMLYTCYIRLSSAMTSFPGIWLVLTVIAVKTNCVKSSRVVCSNIAYRQVFGVYSVFFIFDIRYSEGGSIIARRAAPSWEVRTGSNGWWAIRRQCPWGWLIVIIYIVGLHCFLWN